jgi:glycosyltransferase involved in cell wall biosynthesis
MRVALVHDWLTGLRGGEKCLRAFLDIYPDADIYTLLHVPGSTDARIDARVKGASFLQKMPGARRCYRAFLPLYPLALRSLRLDGYDLVISLSHAAAKNVHVPRGAYHICYCFTPMRYIWDQAREYLGAAAPVLWPAVKALRAWDLRGSAGVDLFVAISSFVAARIRCFYGRRAEVIYPPVDTSWIRPAAGEGRGAAFLYAGALVPYKRVDLVVEAFNRTGAPLWIVGGGPQEARLRKAARGNIVFWGHVSDSELARIYRSCRALIFPAIEDFGLVPVECMAAGRPVIGMDGGGLRESLSGLRFWGKDPLDVGGSSGVFIQRRLAAPLDALLDALAFFSAHEEEFQSSVCVARAGLFGPERFYSEWRALAARVGLPCAEGKTALCSYA